MGRASKLAQYKIFESLPNCYGRHQKEPASLVDWRQPRSRLLVEVGAGRAEISLFVAQNWPDWQALAVDIKGDRLQKTAKNSLDWPNLAFLESHLDYIGDFLDLQGQADLIWLPFLDPYPKTRQAKHRLTSPDRLQFLGSLLKPDGRLRLKTDQRPLFDFSCQSLVENGFILEEISYNLDSREKVPTEALAVTNYEKRYRQLGRSICYLQASFSN